MEIEPERGKSFYRTLAGAVIPRPIAWVSSRSPNGTDNLAPFSFFNVVSTSPPVVMFSPGLSKDTAKNVLETEEFVVNVVTTDLAEKMNMTSATLEHGESEFDHADVKRAQSVKVVPPRVADSKVSFECVLYDSTEVGGSLMVLGEVVYAHIDNSIVTDGKLDVNKLDAVGRLSGSYYSTTGERFSMERPP